MVPDDVVVVAGMSTLQLARMNASIKDGGRQAEAWGVK
jgi:hypothetical protein